MATSNHLAPRWLVVSLSSSHNGGLNGILCGRGPQSRFHTAWVDSGYSSQAAWLSLLWGRIKTYSKTLPRIVRPGIVVAPVATIRATPIIRQHPLQQRRQRPPLGHRLRRVQPVPVGPIALALRATTARTVEPADGQQSSAKQMPPPPHHVIDLVVVAFPDHPH